MSFKFSSNLHYCCITYLLIINLLIVILSIVVHQSSCFKGGVIS